MQSGIQLVPSKPQPAADLRERVVAGLIVAELASIRQQLASITKQVDAIENLIGRMADESPDAA